MRHFSQVVSRIVAPINGASSVRSPRGVNLRLTRYASSNSRPTPTPRPATAPSAPPPPPPASGNALSRMQIGSYYFLVASLAGAALAGYYTSVLLSSGQPPIQYTLIDSKRAKELQETHQPRFGTHPEYLAAIEELKDIWEKKGRGDQVSTDKEDLESHGISDWSYHEAKVPTVVVWVESTEDVVEVVKVATKYRIPITPFSGGTSLEGHFSSVSLLFPSHHLVLTTHRRIPRSFCHDVF